MAYQNVGTPRFFIDNYMYLRTLGLNPETYINQTASVNNTVDITGGGGHNVLKTPLDNENAFTLSPEIAKPFPREIGHTQRWFIPCGEMIRGMDFSGNMKWYGAILNHNFGDCNVTLHGSMFHGAVQYENINIGGEVVGQTYAVIDENYETILNLDSYSEQQNGSSIWFSDNVPTEERFTGFRLFGDDTIPQAESETQLNNLQIGAVSMGVMYTMPRSVDLSLSMEIEFDGYDEIETIGGSTLTNIRQTGAPVWSNNGQYNSPFSVGNFSNNRYLGGAKRNGRRTWNLKFTFVSDTDLFSSNYMNTMHMETASGYDDSDKNTNGDSFEYNMFTDDSFVAQVWNKTLAGALPFIFQPDSNNNNPDQFCIAKFDMDTLKVSQKAFKSYDFSIKIREVW